MTRAGALGQSLLPSMLLVCIAGWGCGKTSACAGREILCQNFKAASCAAVPGCEPMLACVLNDGSPTRSVACSSFTTAATCPGSKCAWSGGACASSCSSHTEMFDCESQRSTEVDMYGFPLWNCSWAECVGTPKKRYCDDFPKDMCPSAFGCSVQTMCGLGDC